MKFRSTLDSILHLRRLLEERQLLALRSAQLRLSECRQQLESISELRSRISELSANLDGPLPAGELHLVEMRRQILAQTIAGLLQKAAQLEAEVEAERHRFEVTRQQREKVETIRQAQWSAFAQQNARREQRSLDEIFLMRKQSSGHDTTLLGEAKNRGETRDGSE